MNADQAERVQMRREHLEREWTWPQLWDHLRLVHGLLGREVPIYTRECEQLHAERFHSELSSGSPTPANPAAGPATSSEAAVGLDELDAFALLASASKMYEALDAITRCSHDDRCEGRYGAALTSCTCHVVIASAALADARGES